MDLTDQQREIILKEIQETLIKKTSEAVFYTPPSLTFKTLRYTWLDLVGLTVEEEEQIMKDLLSSYE